MNEKDSQLIKAISSGDIKAFENLFRSVYPVLCGYSNKILNNTFEAEEVVQDVFFSLWKNRKRLKINISIKSYLYKSVYNKSLNLIEHKSVIKRYIDSYKYTITNSKSPIDYLQEKEVNIVYINTLDKLPNRCGKIFKLSREIGLKYHEIADKLSISVKTVEADMSWALKQFRQSFTEYNR